jgi:hypothetical protein
MKAIGLKTGIEKQPSYFSGFSFSPSPTIAVEIAKSYHLENILKKGPGSLADLSVLRYQSLLFFKTIN